MKDLFKNLLKPGNSHQRAIENFPLIARSLGVSLWTDNKFPSGDWVILCVVIYSVQDLEFIDSVIRRNIPGLYLRDVTTPEAMSDVKNLLNTNEIYSTPIYIKGFDRKINDGPFFGEEAKRNFRKKWFIGES